MGEVADSTGYGVDRLSSTEGQSAAGFSSRGGCPVDAWYVSMTLRRLCLRLGRHAGALLVVLGASLAGCQTSSREEGSSRTVAAYSFGDLDADLPMSCRVPAVIAAADATLRRRGYSVSSGATTEDRGEVRGEPAPQSDAPSVRIDAYVVPGATRISIKVGFLGNETLSRAILDEILQRFGL